MHSIVEELVSGYCDSVLPRMRSLPIYNTALSVEAVDFGVRDGFLTGVLITPWSMNLVWLPEHADHGHEGATVGSVKLAFPAGEYQFTRSAARGIVLHFNLSLFTTVQDFADQNTARAVAREVLRGLYEPVEEQKKVDDPLDAELDRPSALRRVVSRRALLLGWLAPEKPRF